MRVVLNEAEQRLAKFLARARYERNRSAGVTNAKVGPQSNEVTDLEGIGAELAFCKWMNVYPDMQTEACLDADAVTVAMGRVDVKATRYRNGHLLAVKGKSDNPADSYALMVGKFPAYNFAGWASADDLLRPDNIKNFGHGETFALSQGQLKQ